MSNVNLPIRLTPEVLAQSILPGWQFSLFSVDLGHSSDPDIEKAVIERLAATASRSATWRKRSM